MKAKCIFDVKDSKFFPCFLSLQMIILLLLLNTRVAAQESSVKATSLFDGKTLNGWKTVNPADQRLWYVKDSVMMCGDGINNIPSNTYLHTEKEYGDFEFRCLFRLSGDEKTGMINSGIQYRSKIINGEIVGYQADIGNGYWGDIYDEHRRGKLVGGDLSILQRLLKPDGWNSYIIRVKGNYHELYINGVKTCEYTEKDPKIPATGVIAVQIHSGGAGIVEFRDLTITEL
ncbi:DUF1080 domain-containing protein [Agriterribacter sp.]|uniref:3-keto-disaccharide hydrolase n=1 Tax=Agriterribacter sp. TaxID=2821509 RepID=UPI002BB72978|nr:DUF1080 domain-containing protein [Agriterribacter sp.]HRO45545.1 DUF1080 domain-containing protein [Agriterribacter sp.]HRQ17933.1 DUF1080 domain-containing protein [Agriterribacter sp.]